MFKYDTPIFKSAPYSCFFRLYIPASEIHHIFILIPLLHSFLSREPPRKDPLFPTENYLILKDFIYPVQFGSVDMASEIVCSYSILTFLPRIRLSMK